MASWTSQLWKQYDPINRIIFPGASLKSTYDDKGGGWANHSVQLVSDWLLHNPVCSLSSTRLRV